MVGPERRSPQAVRSASRPSSLAEVEPGHSASTLGQVFPYPQLLLPGHPLDPCRPFRGAAAAGYQTLNPDGCGVSDRVGSRHGVVSSSIRNRVLRRPPRSSVSGGTPADQVPGVTISTLHRSDGPCSLVRAGGARLGTPGLANFHSPAGTQLQAIGFGARASQSVQLASKSGMDRRRGRYRHASPSRSGPRLCLQYQKAGATLPGRFLGNVRRRSATTERIDAVSSAQSLRRFQSLWLLDCYQLPRSLWIICD